MFQTLHEISKNLIFVFVWKYVWKYVNINVSDIKKKKKKKRKNKRETGNLNPTCFVTDGFYIIVTDSWLTFWNGNWGVSVCLYVSVCVFVSIYICVLKTCYCQN